MTTMQLRILHDTSLWPQGVIELLPHGLSCCTIHPLLAKGEVATPPQPGVLDVVLTTNLSRAVWARLPQAFIIFLTKEATENAGLRARAWAEGANMVVSLASITQQEKGLLTPWR